MMRSQLGFDSVQERIASRSRRLLSFRLIATLAALASFCAPCTATASDFFIFGPLFTQAAAVVMNPGSVCVTYAYDRNGNRLTQVTVSTSSSGTWGSSNFGCFAWQ